MTPMSFADREIQGKFALRIAIDWQSVGRDGALYAAMSVFLAIIDPYGAAGSASPIIKFLYWLFLLLVGGFSGQFGFHLADRIQGPPHWALGIFMASATSALGVTVLLYGMAVAEYGVEQVPFDEIPRMYGLVFVIAAAISSVAYLVGRVQEASETAPAEAAPLSKFLERLPVKYRTSELYAVSSEDHYLRVHTSLGEEMILMRLADAIKELGDADGLQTHRSWWVARGGVADTKRENGKLTLILKSGAEAPISRTFAQSVKAAGWVS